MKEMLKLSGGQRRVPVIIHDKQASIGFNRGS